MESKKQPHTAIPIKLENMSFYESLSYVQQKTGIDMEELLTNQIGFKASPTHCLCGHEWSVFDIVIEAVNRSNHPWEFFREHLTGGFGGFFSNTFDLTCKCGITTKDVQTLYKYKPTHVLGWY